MYARFPLAIGGEAHISTQWLLVTMLLLALVVWLMTYLSVTWHWSLKRWWQFAEADRVLRVAGIVGLGLLMACLFTTLPRFGWTHVLATLELLVATGLFILAQAADTDLARAATGSLAYDRPLSSGLVKAVDIIEMKSIWRGMVYVLAGLLGWQVLAAFALADLAHQASLSVRAVWAYLVWSVLPSMGYFLAGWLVITERGNFGALATALAAFVGLIHFSWQVWRNKQLVHA